MTEDLGQRTASLETDMENVKSAVSEMAKDIKSMQNRFAMIMGGLFVLSKLIEYLPFGK